MTIPLELAVINLSVAVLFGALIGSERQVRQRMAGLRTNALVALGAAGFVVFSALFPDELSPTRVGAQVVSGIGFLGAGIIFRNGFTVHGLNTAATLWCSAAVGVICGAGALPYAALLTLLVVFINLGLRPVVKWIKRTTRAGMPLTQEYSLNIVVQQRNERKARELVLTKFSIPGFDVQSITSRHDPDEDTTRLNTQVSVQDRDDTLFKAAILPLMSDPKIKEMDWESITDG